MKSEDDFLDVNDLLMQDSGVLFRKIFDQAASGIAITESTGIIRKVNQKFCDIIGYSEEEIVGRNFKTITYSEDIIENEKMVRKINEEGIDSLDIEKRYIHKSGKIVWVHIYVTVIRDSNCKYRYGITIINDISDRKKAEEDLRESEEKYRLLFQNMTDACMICEPIWDKNGKLIDYSFVEINPAFEKVFDKIYDKIKGMTAKKYFGSVSEEWLAFIEGVLKTGKENSMEMFSEGSKKHLKANVFRFRENQFAIVTVDNTERENTQDQILMQKKLLDETFDAITEVIIITDTNRIIQKCNKGLLTTFGYSEDELVGKSVEIVYLNHNDFVRAGSEIYSEQANEQIAPVKMMYRRKDGTIFLGETYGRRLYSENGKYIGNFGLTRDVTQRENLLRELVEAKEKAVESDKLKSAFLANMSHEIRTPMNGILGFSELLSRNDLSEEARQHYVDIINESSKQLLNIVNDIIDISKIETGQIDIYNTEVLINEFLFELYTFFKPIAEKKKVKLFFETDLPDRNSKMLTDSGKLKQIMNNLISNAIKFTAKGSVKIGCQLEDDMLEFFVSDTGIGIAPENFERIFDRFSQVEHPERRKYGGTGLGLSITKAFVERLGGEIYVDSGPEKGTTFKFTLPYSPRKFSSQETGNKIFSSEIDGTILIVEDEDINFLYLKEVLERRMLHVLRATNGKEAIEKCARHPEISLVLMDIKLPGMDGYEATSAIKKDFPDLVIVAQTAYALTDDKRKAFEAGCDGYLAKPITVDRLMSTIYKLMPARKDQ